MKDSKRLTMLLCCLAIAAVPAAGLANDFECKIYVNDLVSGIGDLPSDDNIQATDAEAAARKVKNSIYASADEYDVKCREAED